MQKKEIATYVEQAIITFQTNNSIKKKKKTVLQQDEIKILRFLLPMNSTIQRLYKCLPTKWNSSDSYLMSWQIAGLNSFQHKMHLLSFSLKSVMVISQFSNCASDISHSPLLWIVLYFSFNSFPLISLSK